MKHPYTIYLAGYISDKKALECAEWRVRIKNFFNMKPKWHGQLCFIDPMNGESVASLGKEGLTSCFPPHAIVHRDYNSVLASDLIIANPNTFGEPREPIGCYTDDTEVLTEKGWILLKDVVEQNLQLKVATLSENLKLEYQKIDKYYKFPYSGKVYHIKGQDKDLIVTPNHRMIMMNSSFKKIRFERADSLPKKFFVPKKVYWEGNEQEYFTLPEYNYTRNKGTHVEKVSLKAKKIKMDDWLNFLGWYIAEGCCSNRKGFSLKMRKHDNCCVIISQKKKENFSLIEKAIKNIDFHFYKNKQKGGGINFTISNKQLYLYLYNLGKSDTKHIPHEYKNLSSRQLTILYNSLCLGDGYVGKKYTHYFTVSKQLADDLQELLLKINKNGNIHTRKPRNNTYIGDRKIVSDKNQYTVIEQKSRYYCVTNKNIYLENYTGNIYCLEVKNHSLFVRRKNINKAMWCGNTICEMAWAFQLRKPIIMISDNYRYINHPFTSYFASAIVKDTDELLKGNLIQQFYKGLANG